MTAFSSSRQQHQVFINFCSEVKNVSLFVFFYHLVEALKDSKINVCTNISEKLQVLPKNNETRIALVIFSGKYTESTTCLRELAKINECVEKGKVVAIPIFFRLDESTVRELRGQFGDTLRHLSHESKETKNIWKAALQSISGIKGHKVDKKSLNSRPVAEIVKEIVEDVKKKMKNIKLEESQKASKPKNILKDSYITLQSKTCGIKQSLKICCGIFLLLFTLQQISYTPLDIARTEKPKDQDIDDFFNSTITNSSIDGKVKPSNIQVFINFYKDEVGNNFISFLVEALERNEVNVFIGTKEKIGEDHKNRFNRIKDSGIAIVVFSSRYPESDDCLDELVKIEKRAQKGRLKVFPIFYKVPISDVKDLKGTFGDHFREKEIRYESEIAKIRRWKKAIKFVTDKHALKFDEKRCSTGGEANFVRKVVKEVLKVLQDICVVEKKPFWWFKAGRKLFYS